MNFFVRNPNSHNNRNPSRDSSRWAFEELKNSYVVKELMGEGCFGTVHKVRSRIRNRTRSGAGLFTLNHNKLLYACKTIPRSKVDDIRMLKEECSNLEDIRGHPHLLDFEKTFEDNKEVHIITELLEGGELYEAILEMKKQRVYFPEADSAWMVHNILDGLSYCHDVTGIVHRDLKASNFMFKRKIYIPDAGRNKIKSASIKFCNSHNLREIKIIDFGLSTKIDEDSGKVQGCLGTPYYVAPEVLTEEFYDSKCDVWSVGVIAYLILSLQLPFQGKDERETVHMLIDAENHQPKYETKRWKTLDPDAIDFCKKLLQVDPTKRPTAREAMSHPWIVKHCGSPPPQRQRINQDHSIVTDFPTIPSSLSFDSLPTTNSVLSDDLNTPSNGVQQGVLMESIPEAQRPEQPIPKLSDDKHHCQWKDLLQRLFSPGKGHRLAEVETIDFIHKESKHPRSRQKTQNTLIMGEGEAQ